MFNPPWIGYYGKQSDGQQGVINNIVDSRKLEGSIIEPPANWK